MAARIKTLFARTVAATALASLALQPMAFADRGRGHDRGGYDRHDDYDDGRGYDDRRGYDDHRGRGRDDHRGRDRGHDRHDRYIDDHYRDYGYRDRPVRVIVNRYPDYRYSDYGYRDDRYRRYDRYVDYRPRYSIGSSYRCHERTRYITDYGSYGLYDPPRGYHWVRDEDNGDAILASVATGAIIGLIVGAIAYE